MIIWISLNKHDFIEFVWNDLVTFLFWRNIDIALIMQMVIIHHHHIRFSLNLMCSSFLDVEKMGCYNSSLDKIVWIS